MHMLAYMHIVMPLRLVHMYYYLATDLAQIQRNSSRELERSLFTARGWGGGLSPPWEQVEKFLPPSPLPPLLVHHHPLGHK